MNRRATFLYLMRFLSKMTPCLLIIIMFSGNAFAQSKSDTIDVATCGSTPALLQTFQASSTCPGGLTSMASFNGTSAILTNAAAPKFTLYVEDLLPTNVPVGFADPGPGATRIQTLWGVLQYISNTIDLSTVPTGGLRILIRKSITTACSTCVTVTAPIPNNQPVPPSGIPASPNWPPTTYPTTWTGAGGPIYDPTVANPIRGFLQQYINNPATDPAPNCYHAVLQINFDRYYRFEGDVNGYWVTTNIDYENDINATVVGCNQFDLASVILHQMTHCLGWISLLKFATQTSSASQTPTFITTGKYSAIDNAIHQGTVSPTAILGTSSKLISASNTINNNSANNNYWLGNSTPPTNLPVLSGGLDQFTNYRRWPTTNYISHLEDLLGSFTKRQRLSPGDYQEFVMAPFSIKGMMRRIYTKGELTNLHDLLLYNYVGAAGTNANTVPYSTKMSGSTFTTDYTTYANNRDVSEELNPDYSTVIVNDQASPGVPKRWQFNVVPNYPAQPGVQSTTINIANLTDPDPSPGTATQPKDIYVFPNSVVNFKGCGVGGNNSDNLEQVLDGNGNIVAFIYTPRSNFYGRVQFGFNLCNRVTVNGNTFNERGGFVIYTFKVSRGTFVTNNTGTNLVLNGTYEEGTETKVRTVNELVPNTSISHNGVMEGKMMGAHFADAQPYSALANFYGLHGNGCVIAESFTNCSNSSVLHEGFGDVENGTSAVAPGAFLPAPALPSAPASGGDRYGWLNGASNSTGVSAAASLYYLGKDVERCRRYKLSFLARTYDNPGANNTNADPVNISVGLGNDALITSTLNRNAMVAVQPSFLSWYYVDAANTANTIDPIVSLTLDKSNWQEITTVPVFSYCPTNPTSAVGNMLYIKASSANGYDATDVLIDNIKLEEVTTPIIAAIDQNPVTCTTASFNISYTNAPINFCERHYSWSPTTGLTNPAGGSSLDIPNPNCAFSATGPTTYTCTITIGSGTAPCTTLVATTTVPIALPSSVTITLSGTPCQPVLTAPSNQYYTYQWNLNGGAITGATNNTFSPTQTGSYTVTISTGAGCSVTSNTQPITINYPAPVIASVGTNPCQPILEVTPTALQASCFTYQWQLNGVNVSSGGTGVQYQPTAPGNYTVIVAVVDPANGCSGYCGSGTSAPVTVNPLPAPPVAISVDHTNPCQDLIKLTPLPLPACYSYTWTGAGIWNATTGIFTPTSTGTNTYSVVVNAAGCTAYCGTTSLSASATVTTQPVVNITNIGSSACQPVLQATVTVNTNVTLTWTLNGNPLPAFNNIYTITPTQSGTYIAIATPNTGSTLCTGTATTTTNVLPASACCNGTPPANTIGCTGCTISSFLAANPGGLTNNSNLVVFDGIITVDINTTFLNCPNIRFGANASILVQNGKSLTIDKCILKAGCNVMWSGITTNNGAIPNTAAVTIKQSELWDMEQGVQMHNGAALTSLGSSYVNNFNQSIGFFAGGPSSYTNMTIQGNRFYTTLPSTMLAPHAGVIGMTGILSRNYNFLNVGALGSGAPAYYYNSSYGNEFTTLYTGIRISNISPNTVAATAPAYNLKNNVFRNILNPLPAAGLGTVTAGPFITAANPIAALGTAIYAENALNSASTINVEYNNPNGLFPPSYILNCSKGITVYNMNAYIYKTKLDIADYGFSFSRTEGHWYKLIANELTDVYFGMHFVGNPGLAHVQTNTIYGIGQADKPYGSSTFKLPIGIDLNFTNNTGSNSFAVLDNTIFMNAYAAIGIKLLKPCRGVIVNDNWITLNHGQTALYGTAVDDYEQQGIAMQDGRGCQLTCNHIAGSNSNIINLPRINVAGISFDKSESFLASCNILTQIRYGFLTLNSCQTAPTNVRGNTFMGHFHAMLFRHVGSIGSFGDIGADGSNPSIPAYDGNNEFYGTYAGPKIYKVLSACPPLSQIDHIYTTTSTLVSNQSSSNFWPGCYYIPLANFGATTATCPEGCQKMDHNKLAMVSNIDLAEHIAQDSILYSEYQEGASWFSAMMLYRQLYHDSVARQLHPVLDSFYMALQAEAIEDIRYADEIFGIPDTAFTQDSLLFAPWLADARQANDSIYSIDQMEMTIHWINDRYLDYLESGLDSFSLTTIDSILELAGQCPLVAGEGVYLARALAALFGSPTHYNDLEICNNAGVYKGAKGIFDKENDELRNHNFSSPGSTKGIFRIYPNPSHGIITVECEGGGDIEIYDMTGRLMKAAKLNTLFGKLTVDLALNSGVYIYRHLKQGVELHSGKLILLQ